MNAVGLAWSKQLSLCGGAKGEQSVWEWDSKDCE